MGRSSFKKLLRDEKKEAPQAHKPWESNSLQPHVEAFSNEEIHDTRDASGVQRTRVASPGNETRCVVSDTSSQKDYKTVNTVPATCSSHTGILDVYTDASVCKVLGIRRRILADARTSTRKGIDWATVNEEAGMTKAWVNSYAISHGISPDFFNGGLQKLTGDYVSVKLVGTTPNQGIVQVELEATGKREFARVRNIMQHPISYLEVFSCVRITLPADEHLEWIARPNEVKY